MFISIIYMVIIFAAAIAIFGIYIYLYYKSERQRKRDEQRYKLYKITFVKDGDVYTQIVGARTEDGVRRIFYHSVDSPEKVTILNIEVADN